MKKAKHLAHYVPLLGIFFVGILAFVYFSYDRTFQMAVSVALASSYLSWGVIHHKIHKDLDVFVFIEYLGISLLGLLMLLFLIFRA